MSGASTIVTRVEIAEHVGEAFRGGRPRRDGLLALADVVLVNPAESFIGRGHLTQILEEARAMVDGALRAAEA